jgi:long-chain fatty acid transport protein
MKRLTLIAFLSLSLVAVAAVAQAGLMFVPTTYGLSARSVGLGNAMTAVGEDYSTTFFNPAALGMLDANQVDLGYMYAAPKFTGGPAGDTDAVDFDTANKLALIGFTMNLSTLFKNEHGLGLGFDLVMDNNTKSFMAFEEKRDDNGQFMRYGLTSVTMTLGLGVEIIPQLYIGAGGFVMVKGENKLVAETDMAGNTQEEQIQVNAEPAIAPIVSLFAPVHPMVTLGLTYRGKGVAEFDNIDAATKALVSESPLTDLNLVMAFKDTYVPQQVAFGVSVKPIEPLLIAFDVTWANWADYEEEIAKGDVVRSGSEFGTKDVFTPRLGFEYSALSNLQLRLGYFYEATPFDDPGMGNTVVLDNDKHAVSFGLGHDMTYLTFMNHAPSIGASYFMHYLAPRTVESGDGIDYESSGMINGVVGTLTLKF